MNDGETAKLLSDRRGDGHDCSPASLDAHAVSKTHCAFLTRYCAFLTRYALTAHAKRYGMTDFAVTVQAFSGPSELDGRSGQRQE